MSEREKHNGWMFSLHVCVRARDLEVYKVNTRASHHGHTLVFTRFSIGQWTLWEAGHNSQYKESPFTPGLSAGGRLHGFLIKKKKLFFISEMPSMVIT